MSEGKIEQMPHITVALATPEDAKGIRELVSESWASTYVGEGVDPNGKEFKITTRDHEFLFRNNLHPNTIKGFEEDIESFDSEGRSMFVAKDGDRIVGSVTVTHYKMSDENVIETFFLLSEYQNKGVGTRLWNAVKPKLQPDLKTTLTVATYTPQAIRFYEKCGFTIIPPVEYATLLMGKMMPMWKMERPADLLQGEKV